jgi:hypothetical protein
MKNLDLECVPAWRYCQIPRGQKGPRYAGWQSKPYTLDQIDSTGNVGVLLGPVSGGLCALDFDGPSAWTWWDEHIGTPIPTTITWASGKPSRCQMAFTVPEPYWAYIKTLKIATAEGEGFEFRWAGGQSVVPPSLHPTTGAEYFWVQAPSTTDLSDIPDAVLAYWLEQANPAPATQPSGAEISPPTGDEIAQIYEDLKRFYPVLGYDRWTVATWVACRELGDADGLAVMQYHWPEKDTGEYALLLKSRTRPTRPARIGSIIAWIREHDANYRPARAYTGTEALQVMRRDDYKIRNLIRNG